MTLSDIGKSLSNYNRCVTMKSESKIKNYYLDLMRNNNNNTKICEQFKTNKSTTRQKIQNEKIDSLSNLNEISTGNKILTNNFSKFSSIELKKDLFSIENINNSKSPFINIMDSDNSILNPAKNNVFKASENKISNKDSEVTINSMSISSSNNNLVLRNTNNNNNNLNLNSNSNVSVIENNNSLELISAGNRKNEIANHDNHFKSISNSNNLFEHLFKEKNLKANADSNKDLMNAYNKNAFGNHNSKSITDFDFAFAKSRKMKIDETERVQNKLNLVNNLKSNINSAASERNNFCNLRNKNIDQLNENTIITSVSSIGGLNTIDGNQVNYNNFLMTTNNNNNNLINTFNENENTNNLENIKSTINLSEYVNDNLKKYKYEKEQSEVRKENKKSITDDSILKNFKSSNYNSSNNNNFSSSAKKKSNLAIFTNSNNFKYLNDLLNNNKNNNINSANNNNDFKPESEKHYGFFSAEKNKLGHLNHELYIKTGGKPNAPSFDYISGLNMKNVKSKAKENSINPAIRKINEMKNELSHYTNITNANNKKINSNGNNLAGNSNPNNIDFGNLFSNTTTNGQLANSNFNFNFNFFNGPNINSQHSLQNISYNYLSNLGNLENNNNSNINPNENNLNLLMKLLDNKTVNSSNINTNLKLAANSKSNSNNKTNKYKFLHLNNLTNNDFNANNILNLNTNKNKNLNMHKAGNKNGFNNLIDYPITTKNKNINYFNFDENNNKQRSINK